MNSTNNKKTTNSTNKAKEQALRNEIYSLALASNIKFDPDQMFEFLKSATKEELIHILMHNIVDTNINRDISNKLDKIAQKLEVKFVASESSIASMNNNINSVMTDRIRTLDEQFKAEQERLGDVELFSKEAREFIEFVESHKNLEDYFATQLKEKLSNIIFNKLSIGEINAYRDHISKCKETINLLERGYMIGYHFGHKNGYKEGIEQIESFVPQKVLKKYSNKRLKARRK